MVSAGTLESINEPEEIRWRVHPFTENYFRSAVLVLIIIATCVGVWIWSGMVGMIFPALILLIVSVAPYLFPVNYRMNGDGIEIVFLKVKTFRAWDEFRNFYSHDVGVHLSTFRKPSGLDPFRGSFIRFAPGNRDIVLRFLDGHIRREKRESERNDDKK